MDATKSRAVVPDKAIVVTQIASGLRSGRAAKMASEGKRP